MTLYRKYRPQKFSEVEGQEYITETLKNELALGKVSHAYIFSGPRGTGKTTVARLLAKAVNCQNKTAQEKRQGKVEPCNRCLSCKEIIAGKSLDLIEIDAASNRGIDEIRALRENVRFAPSKSAYKVFIIDEVHMLTREAFNALLKTLEEPPARTLFILATTGVHEVPPTILSRCERFDFRKLNPDQIERRLTKILKQEKRSLDPKILNLIATKADGALRDAESTLGQILTWRKKEIKLERVADFLGTVDWSLIFNFLHLLIKKEGGDALRLLNQVVAQGYDLKNFGNRLIDSLRTMMLAKINPEFVSLGVNLAEEQKRELLGLTPNVSLKNLAHLTRLFVEAKNHLERYPIPQLPLELAVVDWCNEGETVKILNEEQEKAVSGSKPGPQKEIPSSSSPLSSSLPSPPLTSPSFNLEQVLEKWQEVIAAVQPLNYSLCAFLKLCRPVAFKNGSLVLGFPRDFHKNIVAQSQNKQIVERALDSVLGGRWRIQCEKAEDKPQNHLTREVLEVFGGQVVK